MVKIDIFDADSQNMEFSYSSARSNYAMRVCGSLTDVNAIMNASAEEYCIVETEHGTATAYVSFDRFSDAEDFLNVVSMFFNCKDNNLDFNEAVAECEG